MSYKTASYIALGFLILLAGVYLWSATELRDPRTRGSIGPGYFPIMLGVLLVVLCGIAVVQTWTRHEDTRITIPNFGFVLSAIVATGLFLLAWRHVDAFYVLVFVFVAALFSLFGARRGLRQHAINLTLALVLTLAIYGLFGIVMQVRF